MVYFGYCLLYILWLGNLNFADVEGEKSELTVSDLNTVGLVCQLLGFILEGFVEALLFRQIQVRGTVTSIPFKHQETRSGSVQCTIIFTTNKRLAGVKPVGCVKVWAATS